MKTIPVVSLSKSALDYAVTKCEGVDYTPCAAYNGIGMKIEPTNCSTDWSIGGPIIEREKINIGISTIDEWMAFIYDGLEMTWIAHGQTPLIAAMRCYVASKLGDTVEIPNELL